MISFLYTGDYEDGRKAVTAPIASAADTEPEDELGSGWTPALFMNAKIYVIADKYDFGALKDLAKKYEEVVASERNSASFATSSSSCTRKPWTAIEV
jgi:hypothetical protein